MEDWTAITPILRKDKMSLNKSQDRTDPTSWGSKEARPFVQAWGEIRSSSSEEEDESDYEVESDEESESETSQQQECTSFPDYSCSSAVKQKDTITSVKALPPPVKTAEVPKRHLKYGADTDDDILSDSPAKRLSSSPSHRGRSNISKSPSKWIFRKSRKRKCQIQLWILISAVQQ